MRTVENCMLSFLSFSRAVLLYLQGVNWRLHALHIYTYSIAALVNTQFVAKKTYVALSNAVTDEEYVFFKNDPVPYSLQKVVYSGPATSDPVWTYNLTKNTFTAANRSTRYMRLPWLSSIIKYNDMKLYSLDEFIDTMRFSEIGATPPDVQILLSAWSLFSGIVLDKNLEMNLIVINHDGNEDRFALHTRSFIVEELDEVQLLPDLLREETT